MVFDRGCGKAQLQLLDLGRHMDELDTGQVVQSMCLTLGGELGHRVRIGLAGVRVADPCGEELQRALAGCRRGPEQHRQLRDGLGDWQNLASRTWMFQVGHQ
jgi:hypothetical protein